MKIALITIHWANNYGSSLQTFASIHTLSKYGDVSTLDYRNPYTQKGMQWIRWGKTPRDILRIGKDLFRLLPRYHVIQKFQAFSHEHFNLTSTLKKQRDFEAIEEEFDIFISGSDQLWNPMIVSENQKIDGRYFLDFITQKPKLSYASSLGSYQYNKEENPKVIKYLNAYDALSIREQDVSMYMQELLQKPISNLIDPTLMLDKTTWLNALDISQNTTAKPYILVYALIKDETLKHLVTQVRQKLNLEVITIDQDPFTNISPDRHIKDASPLEFVSLFAHASFVITNSFHGTCFALNFNIPFVISTPPSSLNRIESLLSATLLTSRIITSQSNLDTLISKPLDFSQANQALMDLRAKSKAFLDSHLVGRD